MSSIDDFSTYLIDSFSTAGFTDNFHFIRPWWLLAFIALGLILHLLKKIHYYQSPWQHFLPAHLTKVLLEQDDNSKNKHTIEENHAPSQLKPFVIGCCLILALAGPAWQKLPQPVYQLERGSVLIMDMSYSMYATDIKPNRLTRARYKAVDLLEKVNEGDMGLIAYAGDAFIISPLTQDIHNIQLLLPSLSPDIMPELGANALAALTLANETLRNAGHLNGDIYWFTDDVDKEEMADIYDWSAKFAHNLHILGVGTQAGAPIKLTSGELLKDNSGAIVVPKLPLGKLAALAQRGGGNYSTITNDDSDINYLTKHLAAGLNESSKQKTQNNKESDQKQQIQGDQYQEKGPWLLLIIIPLLLSYFRRGSTILSISLLIPLSLLLGLGSFSTPTYASDALAQEHVNSSQVQSEKNKQAQSKISNLWQDLWQTKDQQAQQYFEQKNYNQAAEQFKNSQWQGSAHYKAGNYQRALEAFQQSDSGNALYNQGNSHAQMQQYDKALDAYKKALIKDPTLKDAQDNIDKIEELKKQQEEQEKSQQGEKSEDSDGEKQDSEQDSQQDSQQDKESQDGEQSEKSDEKQQKDGQSQDQSDQQQEEKEQQEQSQKSDEEAKAEEEKKKQEQAEQEAQQQEGKEGEEGEKTAAQIASEQKVQEDNQKHQQILNKVTDDPYLLLRNKMRLEYQKRQHERNSQGVNKKW